MAESQAPFDYNRTFLTALRKALSDPRFKTYLDYADNVQPYAVAVYLWNARLAKAFLYPLQVAEVTVRNAIHNAFSATIGPNWMLDQTFLSTMTQESQDSLARSIDRLNKKLKKEWDEAVASAAKRQARGKLVPSVPAVPRQPSPDDIVASLSFDFWSNLFRNEYEQFWKDFVPPTHPNHPILSKIFPNIKSTNHREEVKILVKRVNKLRNRIAHHEPIFQGLNHRAELEKIIELIKLCDTDVADWVESHSTVIAVSRTPPTKTSTLPGLPLVSANLSIPPILKPGATLEDAIEAIASSVLGLALLPDAGLTPPYRVLTADIALKLVHKLKQGDMIALSDHNLMSIPPDTVPAPIAVIDKQASTGDALALFFPPDTPRKRKPQVLLVFDNDTVPPTLIGALPRPHIRFA